MSRRSWMWLSLLLVSWVGMFVYSEHEISKVYLNGYQSGFGTAAEDMFKIRKCIRKEVEKDNIKFKSAQQAAKERVVAGESMKRDSTIF